MRKVKKSDTQFEFFHYGLGPESLILVLEKSGAKLRKVVSSWFAFFDHGSGPESLIVVLEKSREKWRKVRKVVSSRFAFSSRLGPHILSFWF